MKIGFIDFYLDEWHANNYPKWIMEASSGDMKVTEAFALMDSPKKGGRSSEDWCRDMGIRQCLSMDDLIDRVDGIIVLSPDNAEMHEALCQLPLRSGKPVYVDKTFAPDKETAIRLFDLADRSGTPCYSSSALRFAKEYQGLEKPLSISSRGPGQFETYAVHQVEPALMLMDSKPKKVLGMGDSSRQTLLIAFEDGRFADISCFGDGGFQTRVKTGEEVKDLDAVSDFFKDFILGMVHFFRTKEAPVPHAQTIDIMAVLGAGKRALQKPGTWVDV